MISCEQSTHQQPLEVGYIIAYDDGRLDRFGCFAFSDYDQQSCRDSEQMTILKKIVELEPSTPEASYIFSSIRLPKVCDPNPRTIEYKKEEIKWLLRQLARPGIIRLDS